MTSNILTLPKLKNFWESVILLSEDGNQLTKLNQLLLLLDVDPMTFHQLSKNQKRRVLLKYAIVEFLPRNKVKTLIDKLSTVKKNSLITKLLKILEALLTGIEKDLLPFWTESSKVISQKLLLPTKTDYVDSDSNCYQTSLQNTMSHSWFSIKKHSPNKKNLSTTLFPSSQFTQTNSMEKENMLRTRKIRLIINNQQKQIFRKWMGTARYCYNKAIDNINNKEFETKNKLRTKIVTNYTNQWESETPQGVREGAVFDACDGYITNLKKFKKTKQPFTMSFRRKKSMSHIITLPVDSLKTNMKLYPRLLGNNSCILMNEMERKHIKWKDKYVMKNDIKTKVGSVLDKVIRIQMTRPGKWYLCVPIDVNVKTPESQGSIISLDPGVRTFLTGYSPDGTVLQIGDNDINKIRKYLLKTDKFISKISGVKGRIKHRYEKAKLKRFDNVKNWMKDCHRKTVKYLVDNYDIIVLPPFAPQKMCNRGNRKINNKTVRNMLCWSHYKMRMMLQNKVEEYTTKKVLFPTEEYTSKTCGHCGKINRKLGSSKVFNCGECGIIMDRDINGSRNILIKLLTELDNVF